MTYHRAHEDCVTFASCDICQAPSTMECIECIRESSRVSSSAGHATPTCLCSQTCFKKHHSASHGVHKRTTTAAAGVSPAPVTPASVPAHISSATPTRSRPAYTMTVGSKESPAPSHLSHGRTYRASPGHHGPISSSHGQAKCNYEALTAPMPYHNGHHRVNGPHRTGMPMHALEVSTRH